MRKDFCKKVQGDFKGSVEMSCASFAGSKVTDVCDVYEMSVTGRSMSLPTAERLRMVEVEEISAPLRRPPVPPDLLQPFSHLQLAADCAPSDSTLHIDLVVGQEPVLVTSKSWAGAEWWASCYGDCFRLDPVRLCGWAAREGGLTVIDPGSASCVWCVGSVSGG